MIPPSVEIARKYYEPYTRLHHLNGGEYGFIPADDDHLFDRLSHVVKSLQEASLPYDIADRIRNVPPPDLTRSKQVDIGRHSDILLRDHFRQDRSISERYRKGMPALHDLRKLSDGGTRMLWASSRGFTRQLIDEINRLDSEMMNRKTIQPLI